VTLGLPARQAALAEQSLLGAQLIAAFLAAWLAKFTVNPGAVHALSTVGVRDLLRHVRTVLLHVRARLRGAERRGKDQPGNQFFGLAIGFTVAAGRSRSAP
jgi:aquaporin Z